MSESLTMKLLNCRRCDDVVKLVEGKSRSCECGATTGSIQAAAGAERVQLSGAGRVLEISWEAYDGIAEGEVRTFGVLPRSRYSS
jgi:hypothetical protein